MYLNKWTDQLCWNRLIVTDAWKSHFHGKEWMSSLKCFLNTTFEMKNNNVVCNKLRRQLSCLTESHAQELRRDATWTWYNMKGVMEIDSEVLYRCWRPIWVLLPNPRPAATMLVYEVMLWLGEEKMSHTKAVFDGVASDIARDLNRLIQ